MKAASQPGQEGQSAPPGGQAGRGPGQGLFPARRALEPSRPIGDIVPIDQDSLHCFSPSAHDLQHDLGDDLLQGPAVDDHLALHLHLLCAQMDGAVHPLQAHLTRGQLLLSPAGCPRIQGVSPWPPAFRTSTLSPAVGRQQ